MRKVVMVVCHKYHTLNKWQQADSIIRETPK